MQQVSGGNSRGRLVIWCKPPPSKMLGETVKLAWRQLIPAFFLCSGEWSVISHIDPVP